MEAIWEDVARRTKDFIKHPDRFLENENDETFEKSKLLLKVLYDGTKIATDEVGGDEKFHKNILPELIIEDFDEEQVWTAVELKNRSIIDDCQNAISNLLNLNTSTFDLFGGDEETTEEKNLALEEEDENDDELNFPLPTELLKAAGDDEDGDDESDDDDMESEDEGEVDSEIENEIPEGNDDEDDIMNDPDFQHMSDSDLDDNLPLFDKTDSEGESDLDDDANADEKVEEKKINVKEAKEIEMENKTDDYMANAMKALKSQGGGGFSKKNNVVEDQFFSLDEMENFLDAEDRKVTKPSEDNNDDDNDVDYFGSDFEDEDEEGLNELKKIKYKDYFDPVTGAINEEVDDDNFRNENSKDLLKSDSENDDEMSEKEDLGEIKSSHELKTMRLQKKIKAMEENAIEVKPWQMTGEVAAVERPQNALLEEDLEYDTVSKQAPIITEAVSKRLEDIITQRIKGIVQLQNSKIRKKIYVI